MPPPEQIRILAAGRWLIPVLAQIGRDGGARFASLVSGLGVSRSALSDCLGELQQSGFVARNPGHGHPLRPEYVLTANGEPIAAWSQRIMAERAQLGLQPADLSRWSMPIILTLREDWTRFGRLRSELRPISPRALSLSLKQMLAVELVDRRLEDHFPPVPLYGLTGRGRQFAEAIAA